MAGAQARHRLRAAPGSCPISPTSTRRTGRPSCRSTSPRSRGARAACRSCRKTIPFYEFFRRFGQVPPRRGPEREPEAQSVGSGFIVGSNGEVITNAHVVDGADEVTVRLSDKREFKAKVLGADKRTDVALLKIEAKDLPQGDDRRSRQAARGRMGGRDRQAVRPREHHDRRHRQREGARPAAGEPRSRSSRPTSPSIRATRAGRCST